MKFIITTLLLGCLTTSSFAKPFPDPRKVEGPLLESKMVPSRMLLPPEIEARDGTPVLRVDVSWRQNETFELKGTFLEPSGTPGLSRSALKKDEFGSYRAELRATTPDGVKVFHSSLGTGREFRQLVRTLCFRFPLPERSTSLEFSLEAEHPESGTMIQVLKKELKQEDIREISHREVTVTLLRKALVQPSLKLNFYAEGFSKEGESSFIESARRAIAVFEKHLPGSEAFEFRAVFAVSNTKLGPAQDYGPGIKPKDTFLGLYFPYWRKLGRWYNIVYPTDPTKFRNGLGQAAYDYPLVLVDDGAYWGVGNYMELTAIPINSPQFTYLLLHEFGHFMGLNEEYEGGGPTELEFAPGIKEPWSQNITFNTNPQSIKWHIHLAKGIQVPTSRMEWQRYGGTSKNPVGAYRGGYADSEPAGKSHKPVLKCMMGAGGAFCPVCDDALRAKISVDSGK